MRSIIILPHPTLRAVACEIPPADISRPRIQRLIAEMKAILAAAPDGVGLAAPQVGEPLRLFIVSEEAQTIDATRPEVPSPGGDKRKGWSYYVFINPVLVKSARRKSVMAEGCLSIPGRFGEVARAEKVALRWRDERGQRQNRGFIKFFARVVQHEMDHLDGMLIADRAKKLFLVANSQK